MTPRLTANGVDLLERNLILYPASVRQKMTEVPVVVRIDDYEHIIGKGVLVSDGRGKSTYVKVSREEKDRLLDDTNFVARSVWSLTNISYEDNTDG